MPPQLQVATKGCITDDQGAILLLQRGKPYVGQTDLTWDFPGGRLDPGETLEETLRRELKEETNLELVSIGKVYHLKQFIIPEENIQVVRITFEAKVAGDIKLSHEHVDYRWVKPDEFPIEHQTNHLTEALIEHGLISDAVQ